MEQQLILEPKEKKVLLQVARQSIACCFGGAIPLSERIAVCKSGLYSRYAELDIPVLQMPLACFVTLNRKADGELRGCIGNLEAAEGETLLENIISNSISAAFYDSRFAPLKPEELEEVRIEVSILSKPHTIRFSSKKELFALVRGKGVILRHGYHRATFLPQVWEKLPEPDLFLKHLAAKAGLPAVVFEEADYAVYDVVSFEEE